MAKLTDKQEKFAQLVVDGLAKAEAYRRAYNADGMNSNAIGVEANRVYNRPNVSLRIEELRDELKIRSMWTKVNSVETLKRVAEQGEKDSDVVASVKALNAMYGWDKQVLDHTSSDGSMKPTNNITVEMNPQDAANAYKDLMDD